MTVYHYARGGFELESDWPLPSLTPRTDAQAAPRGRVRIRRGDAPDEIAGAARIDALTQVAPDQMLFVHPTHGRFWVRNGEEIVAAPAAADGTLGDLRPFLLGSGFAALAIQNGDLLLHASAAAVDGRAVAFAGVSGAGKSTLLGAFIAAGHAPVADDLCFVESNAGALAKVWPAPGRLRLWPDSVAALGLGETAADREIAAVEKLELALDTTAVQGPLPLAAVFILKESEAKAPLIEPIAGPTAITELAQQLFRPYYAHAMGGLPALLPRLAHAVDGGVRILRLRSPRRYDALPEIRRAIRAALDA